MLAGRFSISCGMQSSPRPVCTLPTGPMVNRVGGKLAKPTLILHSPEGLEIGPRDPPSPSLSLSEAGKARSGGGGWAGRKRTEQEPSCWEMSSQLPGKADCKNPHELTHGSLSLHPLHRPKATLHPCPKFSDEKGLPVSRNGVSLWPWQTQATWKNQLGLRTVEAQKADSLRAFISSWDSFLFEMGKDDLDLLILPSPPPKPLGFQVCDYIGHTCFIYAVDGTRGCMHGRQAWH